MELTRTDVVFSRIAMVLFLCRNKSSRNDLKLHGTYFWKILKILAKESRPRGPPPFHEGGRRACPLGTPLPHGPPRAPPTSTPTPYIRVRGEKIRENDSSRFTIRSRRQALKPLGRGLIWSPFGAPERGIRRHRHHQPSSITNFMMLTAMRE